MLEKISQYPGKTSDVSVDSLSYKVEVEILKIIKSIQLQPPNWAFLQK